MSDLFKKPIIRPDRNYRSDGDFEDSDIEIPSESPDEGSSSPIDDINELIGVMDLLPEELQRVFIPTLYKAIDDLQDELTLEDPMQKIPVEIEDVEKEYKQPDDLPTEIPIGEETIRIFPDDNGIDVEIKEAEDLIELIRASFEADKREMYRNFVNKLKLSIQQYMRELLYITSIGGFKSYTELYLKYDLPKTPVPRGLQHISDRIIRSQIQRDQKTRMLEKMFSIDHSVFHLIQNKAAYQQRVRYYGTNYMNGETYLEVQENDELRKSKLGYDKKYEQSMYNYYKYLNSSVLVADEIMQSFVSEARGKSVLKKNGVDIKSGVEEEQAIKANREQEMADRAKEKKAEAAKKEEEFKKRVSAGGKSSKYTGGYGDKQGAVSNSVIADGGTGSTASSGSTSYEIDMGATVLTKVNSIRNDTSKSAGQKIAEMALYAYDLRGINSSSRISYNMNGKQNPRIFKKSTTHSDCSSFARGICVYAVGIDIGQATGSQISSNIGRTFIYSRLDLQPGDIVYFKPSSSSSYQGHSVTLANETKAKVNHVGIYVGGGTIVDCSSGSDGIRTLSTSSSYVTSHFLCAIRL